MLPDRHPAGQHLTHQHLGSSTRRGVCEAPPVQCDDIGGLADRFFAAIERGDVDEVASMYADDAVIWHNFDQLEQPKGHNLLILAWMVANIGELSYDEVRRVVLDDGFVQQHVLRGMTRNGDQLEVPAMLRVFCDGERISRIEEYLDTAQVAVLRS
jgi:ketosteroid isomerase-like protein